MPSDCGVSVLAKAPVPGLAKSWPAPRSVPSVSNRWHCGCLTLPWRRRWRGGCGGAARNLVLLASAPAAPGRLCPTRQHGSNAVAGYGAGRRTPCRCGAQSHGRQRATHRFVERYPATPGRVGAVGDPRQSPGLATRLRPGGQRLKAHPGRSVGQPERRAWRRAARGLSSSASRPLAATVSQGPRYRCVGPLGAQRAIGLVLEKSCRTRLFRTIHLGRCLTTIPFQLALTR